MPTASWRAQPPAVTQKGGGTVSYNAEMIKVFMDASETLLGVNIVVGDFTQREQQDIQYYLAARGAKFSALIDM